MLLLTAGGQLLGNTSKREWLTDTADGYLPYQGVTNWPVSFEVIRRLLWAATELAVLVAVKIGSNSWSNGSNCVECTFTDTAESDVENLLRY